VTEPFSLRPKPCPWLGGEPRVIAVDKEDRFPEGLSSIEQARLIDVHYGGNGLSGLMDDIRAAIDVTTGSSLQAFLEQLEDHSHEKPLVVIVRNTDRLLADVGPAVLHFTAAWEGFTHHSSGISSMYLVLETGPREITNAAFYPGGLVHWIND